MSFIDCIKKEVLDSKGLITQAQGRSIVKKYEALVSKYEKTMGSSQAAQKAASDIASKMSRDLKKKKANFISQIKYRKKLTEIIKNDIIAQEAELKSKGKIGKIFGASVDGSRVIRELYEQTYVRQQVIFRQSANLMLDFINEYKIKMLGLSAKKNGLDDMIRVMLGEKVDSADAKLFGDQARKSLDYLHRRYQNSGGIIGKLDNYYPQAHNQKAIRGAKEEEWIQYLEDRIDRSKMINEETGLPYTQKELLIEMKKDYAGITKQGKSIGNIGGKVDDGNQFKSQSNSIASRKEASRFYVFKDADSFLEYNKKFGHGDDSALEVLFGHMQSMARDTAIMEKLGPNANDTEKFFNRYMDTLDSPVKTAWTKGMYDVLYGRTLGDGEQSAWYQTLAITQNIQRAAFLGSANLSAFPDAFFGRMAARMAGINANAVTARYVSLMAPLTNKADKQAIIDSAYVADIAITTSTTGGRFDEGLGIRGKTAHMAGIINKLSLLERMTEAAKNSVTLELESMMSRSSNIKYNSLPQEFREALGVHGITESHWDIIRKTEKMVEPNGGASFIRYTNITDEETANLVGDMIESFRNTVANIPTLRTKAITTGSFVGDAAPGTVNRALFGSLGMFKGFPITVMFNYLLPAINKASKGGFRNFDDLASMVIATTILGGLSIQTTDLARGRTLRDMDTGEFWLAAAMKGGSFGLAGDFMFADYNNYGYSPLESALGPVFGLMGDTLTGTVGNFQKALDGDQEVQSSFLASAFKGVKRNSPFATLSYGRLVFERVMFDQIEKNFIDGFYERKDRANNILQKRGSEFYWEPGDLSP